MAGILMDMDTDELQSAVKVGHLELLWATFWPKVFNKFMKTTSYSMTTATNSK